MFIPTFLYLLMIILAKAPSIPSNFLCMPNLSLPGHHIYIFLISKLKTMKFFFARMIMNIISMMEPWLYLFTLNSLPLTFVCTPFHHTEKKQDQQRKWMKMSYSLTSRFQFMYCLMHWLSVNLILSCCHDESPLEYFKLGKVS